MLIRDATDLDWPAIWPIFRDTVAAGETYAYPARLTSDQAQDLWMQQAPARTVVATDDDTVLGTATMGPNRPGRGSHIATGSFMVGPEARGRGVGRALGEHAIAWARGAGYAGMQFNAVVETNTVAVRLWQGLGFDILATVPGAFRHPTAGDVGLHIMYQRFDRD